MAQLPSKEIAALARVTAPVAPHMKQGFEDIPVREKWPSTPPISSERFTEGCVLPRPLFPSRFICCEPLPDKVDCVVFCSKNRRPILPCLPPAVLNLSALCIDFVKKLL